MWLPEEHLAGFVVSGIFLRTVADFKASAQASRLYLNARITNECVSWLRCCVVSAHAELRLAHEFDVYLGTSECGMNFGESATLVRTR